MPPKRKNVPTNTGKVVKSSHKPIKMAKVVTVINVKAAEIRQYIHDKVFESYTPILQEEYKAYRKEIRKSKDAWDFMENKFEKVTQPLDYTITNLKSLLTAIAKVSIYDKPQPLKFTDYTRVTLAKTINQDAKKNSIVTRQLYVDEKKTNYAEHHIPHLKRLVQASILGVAKPLPVKSGATKKKKDQYDLELTAYQDAKEQTLQDMENYSGGSRAEVEEEYREYKKQELTTHIRTIRRLLKGTYTSKSGNGEAATISEMHDVIAKIWGFAESYRNPSMIAYLIMTLHNLKHHMLSLQEAVEGNKAYAPSQEGASNKLMEFAHPDKWPTDAGMIEQMENNILLFFESVFRKAQNGGFNAQNEYTVSLAHKELTYTDKGSKQDVAAFDLLWQGIIDTKIIDHLQ
ncbi:MAG: hypothetical protein K0S11_1609 [Gammaproteobacteria bacterium]|jgi:hypothetical protein|nr:hypothetical protein [Gammaproteobacteria bacterium]